MERELHHEFSGKYYLRIFQGNKRINSRYTNKKKKKKNSEPTQNRLPTRKLSQRIVFETLDSVKRAQPWMPQAALSPVTEKDVAGCWAA